MPDYVFAALIRLLCRHASLIEREDIHSTAALKRTVLRPRPETREQIS